MSQPLRVLIVEDSEDDILLLRHTLQRGGYDISCEAVETAAAMRCALIRQNWDVITSDQAMPHFSAPAALALAKELRPDVPFIILSGEIDLNLAVSLMRGGAKDYIQKREMVRIIPAIERELREAELHRERLQVDAALIESGERLREVLENSLDASYKRNLLTNSYEYFSPVIARITGYTPDEMKSLPLETVVNLMHPDDIIAVERKVAASLSGAAGTAHQLEYRFKHKEGQYHWLQDRFTVMRGADGHPRALIGSVSDITDRKLAEIDLKESEEKYRVIFNNEMYAICIFDLETLHFLDVNDAYTRLYGYSREELLSGMTIHDITAEQQESDAATAQATHEGTIYIPLRYHRKKDGSVFPVEIVGGPYDWKGRRVMFGLAKDITKRKRAEEALRNSKNQYDRLVANIPVGVYVMRSTAEGSATFEYVSPKVAELFAVSAESFLADPQIGFEPIHPEDLEAFLKLNREHFLQPRPFHWEGRIVVKGAVKWLRIESSPEAQENGEILWHGIVVDISERKLFEDAQRRTEEKFYIAFRISPDSININRLQDGLYLDINEGFSNLTGYTSEDVAGKTSLELNLWVDPQDRARLVKGLREHGEVTNLEAPFRCKNGQIKICLMYARVIELNQEMCILSITRDITERKQADAQIRQLNAELEQRVAERTAQLTAANLEMEAFSYSVSHDLRAPLRTLEGFSAILQQDYSGQLDEQGQHYLARIQEASRRMEQLISDLLTLSRVARPDFTRRAVDLSALAQRIAAELQVRSGQRQVELDIAANMVVQGDENLLKIVLENLLNNAYKFTSRREQATIQVGVLEQEGKPVYFVRDNGAGFNMDYANRLFVPFQRLHSEKEFPGTGIGLATVQRIILRHGGRVWAEGVAGKGATFYFTLAGK
jgi:PAS domain S-box-containing protein